MKAVQFSDQLKDAGYTLKDQKEPEVYVRNRITGAMSSLTKVTASEGAIILEYGE
jgi:hypothetical protein